jgi:hypothetical protein
LRQKDFAALKIIREQEEAAKEQSL